MLRGSVCDLTSSRLFSTTCSTDRSLLQPKQTNIDISEFAIFARYNRIAVRNNFQCWVKMANMIKVIISGVKINLKIGVFTIYCSFFDIEVTNSSYRWCLKLSFTHTNLSHSVQILWNTTTSCSIWQNPLFIGLIFHQLLSYKAHILHAWGSDINDELSNADLPLTRHTEPGQCTSQT